MKKHILYNTITNTLGISYTGNYTDNYPKGKLKPYEIELEIVNLPIPEHDTSTHRAVALDYVIDVEARTYTRGWDIVALTEQELATREWVYPQWAKRLRVLNEPALKMQMANVLTYWDDEGFPRDTHNGYIRLWCNEVLPSHRVFIDTANEWLAQFGEQVHEEDRPEILNTENN